MTNTLIRSDGTRLVYDRLKGQHDISKPGLVFLCGFGSDKEGSKALFLESHARQTGQSFVRFDYFGHGGSDGDFKDGTISRWAQDTIAVIDELTEGPQILIGSSMGGWLMLLAALARKDRIAGLIGIAAAPDFTQRLQWTKLTPQQQKTVMEEGLVQVPSNQIRGPAEQPQTRKVLELVQEAQVWLLPRIEMMELQQVSVLAQVSESTQKKKKELQV